MDRPRHIWPIAVAELSCGSPSQRVSRQLRTQSNDELAAVAGQRCVVMLQNITNPRVLFWPRVNDSAFSKSMSRIAEVQSCEHALTTLFSTFGSNWAFSTYLNSLPWRCEFRCQVTGHFATPASVAYGRPAAATSAPSAQQKDRRPDGRARRAGPSAGARTAPPASCRPTETSTAPWPITPGMQKPLIISPLRPRPPSGSKKNRKSRGPPNERFEPIRPATE